MSSKCPTCTAEIPAGTKRCPECASTLGESGFGPPQNAAAPEWRFTPGTVLAGRYRVSEVLGTGGMGEVYRADDIKLGVPVALKLLPAHLAENEHRLALLLNEVRLARQITHPNVCRIHDVGELDGLHFISMEFIPGENLARLLERQGRLPAQRAVDIARGLCAGLDAAHGQGILHLDLKPSNLMIDDRGEVNINDFGLSLHLGASGPARPQRAGTPAYMAPEQYLEGEVSVATDLYAVGLVLYELFTGHRPFEARSPEKLAWLHCKKPPRNPTELVPGLDPAIERVILRCLAKDPGERPVSAQAVAAAFPGRAPLAEGTVLQTLLASKLVSTRQLVETLGDARAAKLFARHNRLVRDLVREHGGREVDRADGGFLLLFERPIHAVLFARAYHRILDDLKLEARLGIHLGEVVLRRNPTQDITQGAREVEVEGLARPTVLRLMGLASGGQTLLTRTAFNFAQRSAVDETVRAEKLRWLAHGRYVLEGAEEPVEVFEVGETGIAPLKPPEGSEEALRTVGEGVVLGWRPAPGLPIPTREDWNLDRKLGAGGFGEVWIAFNRKSYERRVFKFCYEVSRLRGLQREVTLFRLLKEELGERGDIARILDWNLEKEPYFIESEYTVGGNLAEWAEARGGIGEIPLEERLEIIAQVAGALAAAHSVGVLHKDVKPTNILIWRDSTGQARARLTDFGIGTVTESHRLAAAGITSLGVMEGTLLGADSEAGGTPLYMAPELIEGKVATVQADVFSLGVVLYQMVMGDLSRALASGWSRDIDDPLLRTDIADAVDGQPGRRLANAGELATRLRSLEERRAEYRTEGELKTALERAQGRRRFATAAALIFALFAFTMTLLTLRIRSESERVREQTLRTRELARAAIAGHSLSEGKSWGHLLALEVRKPEKTPTAVDLLHKALRTPVELMVFEGHDHAVLAADWNPRDSLVLTGSQDGTARVWNLETGGEITSFLGHSGGISAVAWSPDGQRALTASWDNTARLWNPHSGEQLALFEGHLDLVASVVWSRDGERVFTASWDGTARIFDTDTGALLATLTGHTDRVTAALPSPDGARVLTASRDGTARLWDADTGQLVQVMRSRDGAVDAVSWNGDGTQVLLGSEKGTACIWDLARGALLAECHEHDAGISSASWNGDGTRILTGSWDGTAQIGDATSGGRLTTLGDNIDWVYASWSPDATRVLTRSRDLTGIWHADSGRRLATLPSHGVLFTASWSPDGTRILTGSSDKTARVWSTQTGEQIHTLPAPDAVLTAIWSADGTQILTHTRESAAQLWSAEQGHRLTTAPEQVSFEDSPRNTRFVTWSPATTTPDILRLSRGEVTSTHISPAGDRMLTASLDHTVRIWSSEGGNLLTTLRGHEDRVVSAAWSADGKRIVTGSADRSARLWDARSGQELARLDGHTDTIESVSFNPQGTHILTGSNDHTARVWAATNDPVAYLQSRIRSRARLCLPTEVRVEVLLEPPEQAAHSTAACEQCTPLFFDQLGDAPPWRWQAYLDAWRSYEKCLGRDAG